MKDERDPDATPRVSASFSFFRSAAEAYAIRLENCAQIKSKVAHAIDVAGAKKAADLAAEFRRMRARFDAWPTASAEEVALERATLTGRLLAAQREAEELLASVPLTLPPR
jgi:hypothetical protein